MECHDEIETQLSFEKQNECIKTPLHMYNDREIYKKPSTNENLYEFNGYEYGFFSLMDAYRDDSNNHSPITAVDAPSSKRRTEKEDGKGLRYFSKKVCEKVMQKGTTTYNEVSNELVREYALTTGRSIEQKNIKRRIYDAFNVLVAMNIIEKDKKEIKWIGSPEFENVSNLKKTKTELKKRLEKKREILAELKKQHNLYKRLAERNIQKHDLNSLDNIKLPFVLVHTNCMDEVYCAMNEERSNFTFTFTQPFWIYDDCEILRKVFDEQTEIGSSNLNFSEELKSTEVYSDLSYCSDERY